MEAAAGTVSGGGKEQMRKCCGTCRWRRHEDISDDWVCANGESDYCTDWTDYDHCCEDWEEREEE